MNHIEELTAERLGVPVAQVHAVLEEYRRICVEHSRENAARIQAELLKGNAHGAS